MRKPAQQMTAILLAIMLALAGCSSSGTPDANKGTANPDGGPAVDTSGIDPDVLALIERYDLAPLPAEDQNYTINMGYYDCDHMTAACIGDDAGIYEALGLKVSVTGNGNVPEAMSAGKMDVAYAGWTTTLGAVQVGTPLFIAAENHIGGAEYLVCSFDIEKPEDLIGKRIAVGSDPENTLNWQEWTAQLGIPSDIEYYENFAMSDSDEYFALVAGQLDAFICCDPWGSMAEYENTGWVMVRQDTDRDSGHGTCCKVAMNYDFAEKHPELAARVLLAHTISLQYMYLHPYKAAEMFAENYNVPREVGLMTLYKKLNEEGRTIRWDLNQQNMQNQLDTMKVFSVRNDINSVDLNDYIDLTYFNNSGAIDFEEFIADQVDAIFPLGMTYEEWRAKAVEVDNIVETI